MVRLAKELRTSEARAQIQDAIQLKGSIQDPRAQRRQSPTPTPEKLFGKIHKKKWRFHKDKKPFVKRFAPKDGKGRQ